MGTGQPLTFHILHLSWTMIYYHLKRLFLVVCLWHSVVVVGGSTPSLAASLNVAVPRPPVTLDPHTPADPTAWAYLAACYQRLVTYKELTTEPVPSLALTWRISDDGRLYTFVLKEGLTFSDGRPVDSEAVRWSFSRLMAQSHEAGPCWPQVAAIQVLGPNTVRFVLNEPCAAFIHTLATPASSVVSPGLVDRPPGYLDRHTLGSGPFMVKGWLPDQPMVLEARPDLVNRPRIDKVMFVFEHHPGKLVTMLCEGQIQVVNGLEEAGWELLKDENTLTMYTAATFNSFLLVVNNQRPWLSRPEIRQALSMAIDYQGLISQVREGAAQRMFGPLPMGMAGRATGLRRFEYQVEAATKVIKENGDPPAPLTLIWINSSADHALIGKAVQANLEAAGLPIRIRPVPEQQFQGALTRGDFDLAVYSWRPMVAAPEYILEYLFGSQLPRRDHNPAHFQNQEIDRLLREITLIGDRKKRTAVNQRIQQIAMEESPYIYLYQPYLQVWLHRSVKNVDLHPMWPEVLPLELMNIK